MAKLSLKAESLKEGQLLFGSHFSSLYKTNIGRLSVLPAGTEGSPSKCRWLVNQYWLISPSVASSQGWVELVTQ